jgi:hypothetical protein
LAVINPCVTVSGTISSVEHESDGDDHVNVTLDPGFAHLLNSGNRSAQGGSLVVEVVPADKPGCTIGQPPKPATGSYDYGICTGANVATPVRGQHVQVVGPYVLDTFHGWMEVHPAWAITVTSAVADASGAPAVGSASGGTTSTPPTTVPMARPTTTLAPGASTQGSAGSCSATALPANPHQNSYVSVSVTSNLPGKPFTAIAHYKTKDTMQSGNTDAAGAGSVGFNISRATEGYTVVVDVSIADGQATCSTGFTPR